MKGLRNLIFIIANWALLVSGVVNLAIGTWAAIRGDVGVAGTSLTAGLLLMFAATIDRFESLKGLGIEAKTRKLDQKIDQADEALKRLREMTEITGAALVDLHSKMGRWDSVPPLRETIILANRVRKIMNDLGSTEDSISKTLEPWARIICFDIANKHAEVLRNLLRGTINSLSTERNNIKKPIDPENPKFQELSSKINIINEFISTRLSNLHKIDLEEYPDKFMDMFDDVPILDKDEVAKIQENARKFIPGMISLRDNLTLVDQEVWVEELKR